MSKVAELATHVPWVDTNGRPTREFISFIQQIYDRIGGISSSSNAEIEALTAFVDVAMSHRNEQLIDDIRTLVLESSPQIRDRYDELRAFIAALQDDVAAARSENILLKSRIEALEVNGH